MTQLVLLFGMPRSGTTWIGKIFDSHPDTAYCHEPDTAQPITALPLLPDPASADRYGDAIRAYVGSIRRMRSLRVSGKSPIFPKSYRSGLRLWFVRAAVASSKLAGKYFRELPVPRLPGNASPLVWKSIESLGRLGVLVQCLPAARAVHVIRHPCGYVASVLRGEAQSRFVSATEASEDFGIYEKLVQTRVAAEHGLTVERLKGMRAHERLAWRWLIFNEKASDELAACDRYIQVVYDDVCKDALEQARKLIEFAGLSWTEQTAEFVRASTGKHNSEYYSVFKDPRVAAERWRRDLDPTIAREIIAVAELSRVGRRFAI